MLKSHYRDSAEWITQSSISFGHFTPSHHAIILSEVCMSHKNHVTTCSRCPPLSHCIHVIWLVHYCTTTPVTFPHAPICLTCHLSPCARPLYHVDWATIFHNVSRCSTMIHIQFWLVDTVDRVAGGWNSIYFCFEDEVCAEQKFEDWRLRLLICKKLDCRVYGSLAIAYWVVNSK